MSAAENEDGRASGRESKLLREPIPIYIKGDKRKYIMNTVMVRSEFVVSVTHRYSSFHNRHQLDIDAE